MKREIVALTVSTCLVGLLGAAPAAAALITFVSGDGSDGNTCLTPATACRQLDGATGALSKTDPTGTIFVLAGEYDTFIVDKSVDIIAEPGTATIGNHFAVPVPGGGSTSILVQGPVIVRIKGFQIYNPAGGIVSDAEVLHVEDCVFTPGGGGFGIDFRPTGAGRELYVSDTSITGDSSPGGGGILIKPQISGSAKAVLDNVRVENSSSGITVDGRRTTGVSSATIRNSVVAGSAGNGVFVVDGAGGSTTVMIEGSSISHNGANGIIASAANATVRVRNSTLTGNGTKGLAPGAGSQIISEGGNVVRGNAVNGAFTSTEGQL
jgi:hypothetical protein